MAKVFGSYIPKKDLQGEYLNVCFSPSATPIQQRWRNNGLSADYLADYLTAYFPGDDTGVDERRAELKGIVSYVANELLENAMKFSHAPSQHAMSIDMFFEAETISLYVTNCVAPEQAKVFQKLIQRLLHEDPQELYTELLEREHEGENDTGSGLGLLTMLNDYEASLAWKFESPASGSDVLQVTTMVRLAM